MVPEEENEKEEKNEDRESPTATIKSISALLASIVALVTATGSWMKPQDTTPLQKSYETLSADIKKLSEDNAKQQETIIALKTTIDILMEASARREIRYGNRRSTLTEPNVLFQTFEQKPTGTVVNTTETPEKIEPIVIKPFKQVIDQ